MIANLMVHNQSIYLSFHTIISRLRSLQVNGEICAFLIPAIEFGVGYFYFLPINSNRRPNLPSIPLILIAAGEKHFIKCIQQTSQSENNPLDWNVFMKQC